MIKQTLVWTLLPDPAAPQTVPGTTQLSLVLSIRLSNDEGNPPGSAVLPLSRYTQIAAFPSLAFQPLTVIVKKADNTSISPAATLVDNPPNSALWQALFPGPLLVEPFVFARHAMTDPVRSYPAAKVGAALSDVFTGCLAGSVDAVIRNGEGDPYGSADGTRGRPDWETVERLVRRVGAPEHPDPDIEALRSELLRTGAVEDDDAHDPEGWARLAEFHRPSAPTGRERSRMGAGTPSALEFHALLAALADHPTLMIPLGLVRRYTITLPTDLNVPVTIQAVPHQLQFIQNYRPRTQCVARNGKLTLARPDKTAASPFLPLNDTSVYTPIDVDLDAGGLALQNYAQALGSLPRDEPAPEIRPPTLRSAGIFVAEANRQVTFQNICATVASMDDDLKNGGEGDAKTLDASTVQQGIRVDVYDAGSKRWFPLCSREGKYSVVGYGAVPIADEGSVTDAVTLGADLRGNDTGNLTQAIFRWNNWSLVTEPPGKTIGVDGKLTDPGPQTNPALPFVADVDSPAGTLPPLRFGRTYRFRARLVDLAGRSTPFTVAPVAGEPATVPLRFSRYDPVPAPVLVLRRPVTAGESPVDLVVRTDNGNPAAVVTGPTCERHLLPPKASVELAERHGVLDLATGHRPDPAVHALLTKYDGGKVTGTPDPGAGGSPYKDTDTFERPWLPDPLCRGPALRGVPGTPELVATWPSGGAGWYQRLPMRLIVEAGPITSTQSTAVVDTVARTIRVKLHPAASFPASLSSVLAPGDEDLLGQWRWYAERARAAEAPEGDPEADADDRPDDGDAAGYDTADDTGTGAVGRALDEGPESDVHELFADAASTATDRFGLAGSSERDDTISALSPTDYQAALGAVLAGRIGQLTPATGLTMVHAVRCPVTPPTFAGPRVLRQPAQTVYAFDEAAMAVHGASTLAVHTVASWTEYSDLTGDGLVTSPASAVLRPETDSLGTPGGPALTKMPFRSRHDPGDTRHRVVTYTPVGASRFVPYFTQRRTVSLSAENREKIAQAFVPGTVVVRAAVAQELNADGTPRGTGTTYRVGTDVTVYDGTGEVARIAGGAIANGGKVEVSYVVPPVTRAGPPVTLHVPSTVRAPAPVVHSVMPAFTWQRTTTGNITTSVRKEGTVRIHLKRPWYLTGEGELLGVRVVDPTTDVDLSGARDWATAWGRDPIRDSAGAPAMAYPTPAHLDERAVDVRLAQGHALGFPVEYDRQRRLWYADVRFKADTLYQPFVHLMVVRLQPDSLTAPEDLRASPVVDAGWVQLPAYRRARIEVGGTAEGSPVKVSVVAAVPPPGLDGLTSEFKVSVQFRTPLLPDDAGWMEVEATPPVRMNREPGSGPVAVWTQKVKLPVAVGVRPMRVVVREYDVLPDSPEPGRTTSRISYLDTIPI
ncbi:hypothetical protein AB0F25_28655 [Streptomyces wedmorensis]|uniref:hypothetical protein n=1 Tax=Streptomyces wedmorensis TaxID=43759 RepID=UPI003446B4D1